MEEITFQWDHNKNIANQKNHGIRFEDAKAVFEDEHAILFDDPDHSLEEDRFLIIGMDRLGKICIVSHCYREPNHIIRIISARIATRREKTTYCEGL